MSAIEHLRIDDPKGSALALKAYTKLLRDGSLPSHSAFGAESLQDFLSQLSTEGLAGVRKRLEQIKRGEGRSFAADGLGYAEVEFLLSLQPLLGC
jgi:hypothetical protein